MNDKKKRLIRDLNDLADSHRSTADTLNQIADDLEEGVLQTHEFVEKLEDKDQRAYLEVVPP